MALNALQRRICRLLADARRRAGASDVAGGAALGEALRSNRVSRDLDVFHDDEEALRRTWEDDRALLTGAGLAPVVVRERPSFVQAEVEADGSRVVIEWARDSAFRFLPLVEHQDFGLTLHPLDLATNKLLATVGRLEVRDWVDLVDCCAKLQPLGYLAWAAAAKDPGFNPRSLIEHAARSARYSQPEIDALEFAGPRPDLGTLSRAWHAEIDAARDLVKLLPPAEVGKLVLLDRDVPFRGTPEELRSALAAGTVRFHAGRLRGAWPDVRAR
jgi:hypothetical protein